MLIILAIIAFGVGIGIVLRKQISPNIVSRIIMILIYILLLILGVAVGANDLIVSNLGTIGVKAAVIAVSATIGSMLMAKLLYMFLYKGKVEDEG